MVLCDVNDHVQRCTICASCFFSWDSGKIGSDFHRDPSRFSLRILLAFSDPSLQVFGRALGRSAIWPLRIGNTVLSPTHMFTAS